MKVLIRILTTIATLYFGVGMMSSAALAVEMNVDVGIEFTETQPDPTKPSEPEPTKPPVLPKTQEPPVKPTPPRLPQTGEKIGKSSVVTGGLLVLVAGVWLWKRGKEAND